MNEDELNRILSGEQDLAPSSGFVAGVMEAVRREAATPPPIPFPWKRALPGLAAGALAFAAMLAAFFAEFWRATSTAAVSGIPRALVTAFEIAQTTGAPWVVVALLLSLVSIRLAQRLSEARS